MRTAALYDIHGNLPALDAVLVDVQEAEVDRVVVGGDVVPGPMPAACLELLAALEIPTAFLAGNGERDVIAAARGEPLPRVPEAFRPIVEWSARSLSVRQLADISSWPATLSFPAPGIGHVLFCHATPRDDNEIFTRRTPEAALRPVFEPAGAGLVVCGHTHMQFDRRVGSVRVVNAGSVGMPFGEPGAWWLLVEEGEPVFRRTRYDTKDATRRIAASGYPGVETLQIERPPSEESMLSLFTAAEISGD